MTALGTVGITTCDQGMTLLAFFCRWVLVRTFGFVLRFDLVDRPMTFDVAAEIKDEAILFVGMQAKTATDALIEQSRRHRRAQHHHAIDSWGIKARRENIDVAKKS